MPSNVTPYNIPVPGDLDPVNVPADLNAMATAVGTALDGKEHIYGALTGRLVISGRYYGITYYTGNNTAQNENDMVLHPFVIPATATFDRIAIQVATAVASSTMRLGVYAHNPATENPAALLFDAGTVDSSTTGTKEITINETLAAGIYWFAYVAQGGAPTARSQLTMGIPFPANDQFIGAAANPNTALRQSGVSGALPDPAVPNLTTNIFPRMALRAA